MTFKVFILLVTFFSNVICYDTFYMERFCTPGVTVPPYDILVGKTGMNSSGILKATDSLFYSSDLNCSAHLVVPEGYGIVISIRFMELRNFQCQDYLQLVSSTSTFTECGPRLDDFTESRSFRFFNNATVRFHTSPSLLGLASGFQLSFTAVKRATDHACNETEFKCRNDLCIWDGLKCDMHNNCGDKSDERIGSPSNCGYPGYRFSLRGLFLSLLSILIVAALLTYICRRYRQRTTFIGSVVGNQLPPQNAYSSSASYGTYEHSGQPMFQNQPSYPPPYPQQPPTNYAPYPQVPPMNMPPPPPYSQKAGP